MRKRWEKVEKGRKSEKKEIFNLSDVSYRYLFPLLLRNLADEHPIGRVFCFLLALCVTGTEIIDAGHAIVEWHREPCWIMVGTSDL